MVTPEKIRTGDILLLYSGASVCTDCTVVTGSVEVDESIVTGESEPVTHHPGDTILAGAALFQVNQPQRHYAKALHVLLQGW